MEPYKQLEQEYANFCGSRHAVSCSSGTAALHLGLLALGVGAGDEVIVPDFTMAACAFAVSYTGATPIFADVDPINYAITLEEIKRLTTERTKAIMVVHVYGRLAGVDAIVDYAHARGISVIEDACEAQGAIYQSKADLTIYSFFKNKIIAAQEGGIITTDNVALAAKAAYLKNMAFDTGHTYFHRDIGYNYRMPDAMAHMALESLRQYNHNAALRYNNARQYDFFLKNKAMPKRAANWFYEVSTMHKTAVLAHPKCRDSFKGLSTFPMYVKQHTWPKMPVSASLSELLVLLPVGPDMTLDEIREIAELV